VISWWIALVALAQIVKIGSFVAAGIVTVTMRHSSLEKDDDSGAASAVMFCVTIAACALIRLLGSRIENTAVRMAQAKPKVATRATPEVAVEMSKAYRSLRVLIGHRIPHSTTEQHFTTEKSGGADESAGAF
jgi:hypothetical protein